MWFNFVLESAILANVLAQIIKVPLRLITKKEWRPTLVLSTGGMPSSHSAFVAALATAVSWLSASVVWQSYWPSCPSSSPHRHVLWHVCGI